MAEGYQPLGHIVTAVNSPSSSSASTGSGSSPKQQRRWCCISAGTCVKLFFIMTFVVSLLIGIIQRTAPRQPYSCTIASLGCPRVNVYGFVAPGWEDVAQVFRNNYEAYYEENGQLTVYRMDLYIMAHPPCLYNDLILI
jgi:hypothetical protein